MKCKEAEKGTKRKKERKPALDILTIGQSDFDVQTWKKKKTSPIYILISYLFHCFNPPLLGIQHPGLCVWEGRGGQACSLSLERKEKWEKGKGK